MTVMKADVAREPDDDANCHRIQFQLQETPRGSELDVSRDGSRRRPAEPTPQDPATTSSRRHTATRSRRRTTTTVRPILTSFILAMPWAAYSVLSTLQRRNQ
jgi:hypothetical protein